MKYKYTSRHIEISVSCTARIPCNLLFYPEEGNGCPKYLTISIAGAVSYLRSSVLYIQFMVEYLFVRADTFKMSKMCC